MARSQRPGSADARAVPEHDGNNEEEQPKAATKMII